MKIKWKIIMLPVIAIIGMALMIALVLYVNNTVEKRVIIPQFLQEVTDAEKSKIKALILMEVGLLNDALANVSDVDEKIEILIEQTDRVKLFEDNSGYFFLYDYDGNRINSPGMKGDAKISGNFISTKDSNGKEFIRELANVAKNGGGYVEYWFPKKGETVPAPKVSYSMPIEGTDIFIGTGVYIDEVLAHVGQIEGNITDEMESYTIYIVISGIAYIVILGLLAFYIIKGILKGLNGIKDAFMNIVNDGDTTISIAPELLLRKDEIGDLADASNRIIIDFEKVAEVSKKLSNRDWCQKVDVKSDKDVMNKSLNSMINAVNSTLSDIARVINEIDSGVQQVSLASQALSTGATSQAASIEEVSASLTEMSSRTNENAQNATEASTLTQDANSAAIQGQSQMQELAQAIGGITNRAEDTKKVVKTIDDIAFQTNLLALNAAVEAARAGQHGKGFAVVAEEVRSLAARSAKAAGETAELIDNVVKEVNAGNIMAESTAKALNAIAEQISQATVLVAEIAEASNEQAQGISQINLGIDQIDAVTQQNTASAEETAAASEEMSQMATQLNQTILEFKLKEDKSNTRSPVKRKKRPTYESPNMSGVAAVVTPNEQIKLDNSDFGKF